jgi:NifU-like protein involved in Fe-S cluster formation
VSNISGQNIDIDIKLNSSNKIEEAKYEEEEELPSFKFLKPNEKVNNFEQPFNRKLISIEPNPLDSYDLYPENLFGKAKNNLFNGSSSNNYLNNIENNIKLKSCYLLAKIPNWRLVTNFVPASALNKEKFSNILTLDESKDGDWAPGQEKTSLVFNEKYEETVDKFLEQNKSKKKQLNMEFDNMKYIIFQYHYDILKIKNKINQNQFEINCLNVKMDNCKDAIEQKIK